jgi:hypothetical protein
LTDVSEVFAASIIRAVLLNRVMKLATFYKTTRRNIVEGYRLHNRHRDKLKS